MQLKKITQTQQKFLKNYFSTTYPSSLLDQWTKTPSQQPLKDHPLIMKNDQTAQYKISETEHGVKVITEQSQFPSMLDLGLLQTVGTRNENSIYSGALFLQQFFHLANGDNVNNFILNYNKLQFSGAQVQMTYDQESVYYKNSCLHEDFMPMLDLLLKSSLSEKTYVLQDATLLQDNIYSQTIEDMILPAAYGNQGLGMLTRGTNAQMTQDQFLEFQRKFITPKRTIISAANVDDHDKFVELINSKLFEYPEFLSRSETPNEPSKYTGGELRMETEEEDIHIAICFETVDWKHEDMAALQIVNTILGNSSSFSTGGPGKGMHSRTSMNMLNRLHFIESASSVNHHFTDSGLFGLRVSGPHQFANNLIQSTVDELKKLGDPIDDVEFLRGQNLLFSLINLSLERQVDRLEEITKNIVSFGKLQFLEYENDIYKVTQQQVQNIIQKMLKSKPTIVIMGKNANKCYSYDQILNMLQQ